MLSTPTTIIPLFSLIIDLLLVESSVLIERVRKYAAHLTKFISKVTFSSTCPKIILPLKETPVSFKGIVVTILFNVIEVQATIPIFLTKSPIDLIGYSPNPKELSPKPPGCAMIYIKKEQK